VSFAAGMLGAHSARMKRITMAMLVFLAACAPMMSSGSAVELTAARSGASVTLTLTNRSDSAIGYNLCTSALERRETNDWVAVRTDEVCTMELRSLRPDATATFEKTLPPNLRPGTYRYVTSIEQPMGGSRIVVATDSFKA
jgi:hypothetical protein